MVETSGAVSGEVLAGGWGKEGHLRGRHGG